MRTCTFCGAARVQRVQGAAYACTHCDRPCPRGKAGCNSCATERSYDGTGPKTGGRS